MKKNKIVVFITVMLVLLLTISLASCTPKNEPVAPAPDTGQTEEATTPEPAPDNSGSGDTLKFLLVSKIAGIPYYDRAFAGAEQAGKDLGVEVVCTGPVDASATGQVKIIEDALAQGYAGIGVAANDEQAFVPIFTKAREMGIVTTDWDSPVDQSVVDYSMLNVADYEYAIQFIEELVAAMGPEGEYVIITGGLNATNLNTWIDIGEKYREENYPGLKLVTDKIPTDERADVAYQKANDVLAAYPNLKGIITQGSPVLPAVGQALVDAGREDLALVGNTTPNAVNDLVKAGVVNACLMWDPADAAYTAVYVMKAVIEGTPITDGMKLDFMMGTSPIKVDGKVIVCNDPINFTPDNIDNYDF